MTTNDTTAVDHAPRREVELLQAMAAAGDMQTQARLGAELEKIRTAQRNAHATMHDWAPTQPLDRWAHNPNPASIRTSGLSDWIMNVPLPQHTAEERDRTMIAEASLWYTSTVETVRADPEEFDVQAVGASAELASQFGEDAGVAQRTFLDHLSHLAGRKVAEDILTIPVGTTQTAPAPDTTPMDQVNVPSDTGPAEVDHSHPSDNPSLSEGNAPAGDSNAEPVSQSATENNAGDSGDPKPTVDNRPANPTVLPPATRGAKRQAIVDKLAKGTKCLACGEAIHQDEKGNWRHAEYLYQRGHKRNHVAAPAPSRDAAKTASQDSAAGTQPVAQAPQQGGGTPRNQTGRQYNVSMEHPSGGKYSTPTTASSPEEAIAQVRRHFQNADEASNAKWHALPVQASKHAAVPTEDGLNSAVDFQPDPDPSNSMSLGENGENADWPAEPTGNPQTMTNPTVSTATLFDVATDQPIARANEDHELVAQASADGTLWVDGDLMVIAAEIAAEPYVRGPVRRAYIGVEADPSELTPVNQQQRA